MVDAQIEDIPLQMEVDTGAAPSIILGMIKRKYFPELPLRKIWIITPFLYRRKPEDVGGDENRSRIWGTVDILDVEGCGRKMVHALWLGLTKMTTAGMKKYSTKAVEHNLFLSIDQLCAKYNKVFKEEFSSIHTFEETFKIDGEARPKILPGLFITYSIWDAVGEDLELKLKEVNRELQKVVHSKWAIPTVVVPKSDRSYSICGVLS